MFGLVNYCGDFKETHFQNHSNKHFFLMSLCVCLFFFSVPIAAPDDVAVEVMNGSVVKVTWTRVHKDKLRGHLGGYRVMPHET